MIKFWRRKPKQTAVIVLGMHRSGTSCLVGSLQQKGLFLGEVFEWSRYNLKGNRENVNIMRLNDSVLSFNHGSWNNPPSMLNWNKTHVEERDGIIKSLIESKKSIFGFKDPRLLYTLPFWNEGFSNVKLIGSFRHPLKVAKSLNKRNSMPLEKGLKLWKLYNMKLIHYTNKFTFPLVSFDVTPNEYLSKVEAIADYLGLNYPSNLNENPFYDETLISNNTIEEEYNIPKSIMDIYLELLDIYYGQRI